MSQSSLLGWIYFSCAPTYINEPEWSDLLTLFLAFAASRTLSEGTLELKQPSFCQQMEMIKPEKEAVFVSEISRRVFLFFLINSFTPCAVCFFIF